MPTTAPGGGAVKPDPTAPFGRDPFGMPNLAPPPTVDNNFGFPKPVGGSGWFSLWSFLGINPAQLQALAMRGAEIVLGAAICAAGAAVVVSGSKEAQAVGKAAIGAVTKGAETAAIV